MKGFLLILKSFGNEEDWSSIDTGSTATVAYAASGYAMRGLE
jgi:hypothetical protein